MVTVYLLERYRAVPDHKRLITSAVHYYVLQVVILEMCAQETDELRIHSEVLRGEGLRMSVYTEAASGTGHQRECNGSVFENEAGYYIRCV